MPLCQAISAILPKEMVANVQLLKFAPYIGTLMACEICHDRALVCKQVCIVCMDTHTYSEEDDISCVTEISLTETSKARSPY